LILSRRTKRARIVCQSKELYDDTPKDEIRAIENQTP